MSQSAIQQGAESFYTPLSPEEPYLFETGVNVFGGSDDPLEFSFGSTSQLPSGGINPEDFAAFPEELFRKGYVQHNGAYRVVNPKTKKMAIVIARHAERNPTKGLSLAPHTYLELGQSDNYIIDMRPVPEDKYPRAIYPGTERVIPHEGIEEAGSASVQSGDLSGMSMGEDGGAPGGGTAQSEQWLKDEETGEEYRANPDGSETYRDGATFHEDGAWSRPVPGAPGAIAVWTPGMKSPKIINAKADANKPEKIHKLKDVNGVEKPYVFKDGRMQEVPVPGNDATPKGEDYANERRARILQSVSELEKKVTRWNTGIGSLLKGIPETDARNFSAELESLKANIAFGELTEMRNASKSGGALGQVSDKESALLSASLGALDAGQSPENLKKQLAKVRESIERWNEAKAKHSAKPATTESPKTEGKKSVDIDAARKWLAEHPNDPKAKEVQKRLELLLK